MTTGKSSTQPAAGTTAAAPAGPGQTVTQQSPPPQFGGWYNQLAGQAMNLASQPWPGAYPGVTVAQFQPQQTQAFQEIGNIQGQFAPFLNAAGQAYGQATQPLWPSLPQFNVSGLPQAGISAIGNAPQYGAAAAQAATSAPANLASFYSPFTQQVAGNLQNLFNQQNAQQLAQVAGSEVGQGAFGGDRQAVAEALTAQQENLAQAPVMAQTLQQGFQAAQQQAAQQAALEAQTGLGAGQLNLAAGQGLMQDFGQQQQAQLAAEQANAWLASQAGFGLAGLGQQQQALGLQGATALQGAGLLQQQLAQEQLNVPYEQWQQMQFWPYQQLQFAAPIVQGVGSLSGGTAATAMPAPSLGSQLLGGGLLGAGLLGVTGAFGSGTASNPGGGWLTGPTGLFHQIGGLFGGGGGGSTLTTDPTSPFFAGKRGGRVGGYQAGGSTRAGSGTGLGASDLSFTTEPSVGGMGALPSVPNVDVSVPQMSGGQGQGVRGPGPPDPSRQAGAGTGATASGGSGLLGTAGSVIGDIAGIAKIASLFAKEGGEVNGYQAGGLAAQPQQSQQEDLSKPIGGLPPIPQIPRLPLDAIGKGPGPQERLGPDPQERLGPGPPKPPTPGQQPGYLSEASKAIPLMEGFGKSGSTSPSQTPTSEAKEGGSYNVGGGIDPRAGLGMTSDLMRAGGGGPNPMLDSLGTSRGNLAGGGFGAGSGINGPNLGFRVPPHFQIQQGGSTEPLAGQEETSTLQMPNVQSFLQQRQNQSLPQLMAQRSALQTTAPNSPYLRLIDLAIMRKQMPQGTTPAGLGNLAQLSQRMPTTNLPNNFLPLTTPATSPGEPPQPVGGGSLAGTAQAQPAWRGGRFYQDGGNVFSEEAETSGGTQELPRMIEASRISQLSGNFQHGGETDAPRNYVTADELDPHPVVDSSGASIVVHYPSEGSSLDLGLPTSFKQHALAKYGGRIRMQTGGSLEPGAREPASDLTARSNLNRIMMEPEYSGLDYARPSAGFDIREELRDRGFKGFQTGGATPSQYGGMMGMPAWDFTGFNQGFPGVSGPGFNAMGRAPGFQFEPSQMGWFGAGAGYRPSPNPFAGISPVQFPNVGQAAIPQPMSYANLTGPQISGSTYGLGANPAVQNPPAVPFSSLGVTPPAQNFGGPSGVSPAAAGGRIRLQDGGSDAVVPPSAVNLSPDTLEILRTQGGLDPAAIERVRAAPSIASPTPPERGPEQVSPSTAIRGRVLPPGAEATEDPARGVATELPPVAPAVGRSGPSPAPRGRGRGPTIDAGPSVGYPGLSSLPSPSGTWEWPTLEDVLGRSTPGQSLYPGVGTISAADIIGGPTTPGQTLMPGPGRVTPGQAIARAVGFGPSDATATPLTTPSEAATRGLVGDPTALPPIGTPPRPGRKPMPPPEVPPRPGRKPTPPPEPTAHETPETLFPLSGEYPPIPPGGLPAGVQGVLGDIIGRPAPGQTLIPGMGRVDVGQATGATPFWHSVAQGLGFGSPTAIAGAPTTPPPRPGRKPTPPPVGGPGLGRHSIADELNRREYEQLTGQTAEDLNRRELERLQGGPGLGQQPLTAQQLNQQQLTWLQSGHTGPLPVQAPAPMTPTPSSIAPQQPPTTPTAPVTPVTREVLAPRTAAPAPTPPTPEAAADAVLGNVMTYTMAPPDPHEVANGVVQAAHKYGVTPAELAGTAQMESRMGAAMGNPQGYHGIFQLGPREWNAMGGGDRNDINLQIDHGAKFYASMRDRARQVLGRDPTPAETYLLHQQGATGGPALLQAPRDMNAIEALAPAYGGDLNAARNAIVNNVRPFHGQILPVPASRMTVGQFLDFQNQQLAHFTQVAQRAYGVPGGTLVAGGALAPGQQPAATAQQPGFWSTLANAIGMTTPGETLIPGMGRVDVAGAIGTRPLMQAAGIGPPTAAAAGAPTPGTPTPATPPPGTPAPGTQDALEAQRGAAFHGITQQIAQRPPSDPPPPPEPGTPEHQAATDIINQLLSQTAPHERPEIQRIMENPWMMLLAAGAGMMAGGSPYALQNIGNGILAGIKQGNTMAQESYRGELSASNIALKNAEVQTAITRNQMLLEQMPLMEQKMQLAAITTILKAQQAQILAAFPKGSLTPAVIAQIAASSVRAEAQYNPKLDLDEAFRRHYNAIAGLGGVPGQEGMASGTAGNPIIALSQPDIERAPPGAWILDRRTGDFYIKPAQSQPPARAPAAGP